MSEPLLNLDTLCVRPAIVIDGERCEILSPDELSVLDSHRFGVWGRRIDALSQSEEEGAAQELDDLYAKVARAVLVGVTDAVFAKLTGAHRIAIADVFTGLLLRSKLGVAGAMATAMGPEAGAMWAMAMPSIGVKPSPGSSDSMAGRPATGFAKRLSRWFKRT